MPGLRERFLELAPPSDSKSEFRFAAIAVAEGSPHRLGMDHHGLPALLIEVPDALPFSGPPLVLQNLTMQESVECSVTDATGVKEQRKFTVLRCTDIDPGLVDYFLRVGDSVLAAVGSRPNQALVRTTIERLIELFRALAAPPRNAVSGLWGELFVIAYGATPRLLAEAWHRDPTDLFDFSVTGERLEVKATAGRIRRHHFTLEQLQQRPGIRSFVASILLEPSPGGPSVFDLVEMTRREIAGQADLLLHVDSVVALTLGSGWRAAHDLRFDSAGAADSLRFFGSEAVPAPLAPMPREVSNVRFVSDLTGCESAEMGSTEMGSLLSAAAPRRRSSP